MVKSFLFCIAVSFSLATPANCAVQACHGVFDPNVALREKGVDPSQVELQLEPNPLSQTIRFRLRYEGDEVGYLLISRIRILGRFYFQTSDVKLFHSRNKRFGALLYLTAARFVADIADKQLVSTSEENMSPDAARLWNSFEKRGITEKLTYTATEKVYAIKKQVPQSLDAVSAYLLSHLRNPAVLADVRSEDWK